jgi:hypothetical protein
MTLPPKHRWLLVGLFATAMGYLEAAVVFYLRTMINRMDPYQPNPLPNFGSLGIPEICREAATMVMLITVGSIAGLTWRGRLGFVLFTFGIWDIAYYVFLVPLTGWPRTLLDWDILFLIPLPWWGPVLAPVSIALLLVAFGILSTVLEQAEPPLWPRRLSALACATGIPIALYVFMADAIAAVPQGTEAVRNVLPQHFNWPLFILAWILMAAPVFDMVRQLMTRYR